MKYIEPIKSYITNICKDKFVFAVFIIGIFAWIFLILSGLLISTSLFIFASLICMLLDGLVFMLFLGSLPITIIFFLIKIIFHKKHIPSKHIMPCVIVILIFLSNIFPGALIYRSLNYINFYARYNQYVKIINSVKAGKIVAKDNNPINNRVEYNNCIIFIRKDMNGNFRDIEIYTGGDHPYLRGGFVYDFDEKSKSSNTLIPHWNYWSE